MLIDHYNWPQKAKPYQLEPTGDWHTWFLTGSRGAGTTRAGVEWVREQARIVDNRILIVCRTASDVREVFVEGEAGIMMKTPDSEKPTYAPSKRKLTWNTGAQAMLVSAEEVDALRGVQSNATFWMDPRAGDVDTLYLLQLCTRLGKNPKLMVAGMLNRPGLLFDEINRQLIKDPMHTRLSAGSYRDIEEHLSPQWIKVMKEMGSI